METMNENAMQYEDWAALIELRDRGNMVFRKQCCPVCGAKDSVGPHFPSSFIDTALRPYSRGHKK